MKFTIDFLREEAIDNAVHTEEVAKSRWANVYAIVFEHEGKLCGTSYRRGTGDSGECPWEYEEGMDEEECPEMEAYEVTVTKYRPIKTVPSAPVIAVPKA